MVFEEAWRLRSSLFASSTSCSHQHSQHNSRPQTSQRREEAFEQPRIEHEDRRSRRKWLHFFAGGEWIRETGM